MTNGYVIDSSILIRFERNRIQAMEMFSVLRSELGGADFAISAVTVMELTYGVARAESPSQQMRRQTFIEDIYASVATYGVTTSIAEAAGFLRGTMSRGGLVIQAEDLLIGVTALHLGYAVLTHNTRHFEMIPGLEVVAPTFTL